MAPLADQGPELVPVRRAVIVTSCGVVASAGTDRANRNTTLIRRAFALILDSLIVFAATAVHRRGCPPSRPLSFMFILPRHCRTPLPYGTRSDDEAGKTLDFAARRQLGRESGSGAHLELLVNTGQAGFYRLYAEKETAGNFTIAVSRGDQLGHPDFGRRQPARFHRTLAQTDQFTLSSGRPEDHTQPVEDTQRGLKGFARGSFLLGATQSNAPQQQGAPEFERLWQRNMLSNGLIQRDQSSGQITGTDLQESTASACHHAGPWLRQD